MSNMLRAMPRRPFAEGSDKKIITLCPEIIHLTDGSLAVVASPLNNLSDNFSID